MPVRLKKTSNIKRLKTLLEKPVQFRETGYIKKIASSVARRSSFDKRRLLVEYGGSFSHKDPVFLAVFHEELALGLQEAKLLNYIRETANADTAKYMLWLFEKNLHVVASGMVGKIEAVHKRFVKVLFPEFGLLILTCVIAFPRPYYFCKTHNLSIYPQCSADELEYVHHHLASYLEKDVATLVLQYALC